MAGNGYSKPNTYTKHRKISTIFEWTKPFILTQKVVYKGLWTL